MGSPARTVRERSPEALLVLERTWKDYRDKALRFARFLRRLAPG